VVSEWHITKNAHGVLLPNGEIARIDKPFPLFRGHDDYERFVVIGFANSTASTINEDVQLVLVREEEGPVRKIVGRYVLAFDVVQKFGTLYDLDIKGRQDHGFDKVWNACLKHRGENQ